MTNRLLNHYHIAIPEVETRYLQVYFLSMQSPLAINEEDHAEANRLCECLLQAWGDQLHRDFTHDHILRQSLIDHLTPSLTRFRHGISIDNPLMSQIHDLYMHTFNVVKNSIACIEERYHCKVSDDEISFLALHLAAALERQKEPLRTILVTHEGAGASAILYQKLTQRIPEIKIIAQESFLSIYARNLNDADLIITTIDLSLDQEIPTVLINSLLHDYDIVHLKDVVDQYYKNKNDPMKWKTAHQIDAPQTVDKVRRQSLNFLIK